MLLFIQVIRNLATGYCLLGTDSCLAFGYFLWRRAGMEFKKHGTVSLLFSRLLFVGIVVVRVVLVVVDHVLPLRKVVHVLDLTP